MNFEELLNASKNVDVDKAFEENEKKGGFERDTRYFQLRRNSEDVGKATIRFLPHMGGKFPFVKKKSHFITHEKKRYIENNRTTLGNGEQDPASKFYQALWDRFNQTEDEYWKKLAYSLKPRERYISLIYVVNDPNDDDELQQSGKVMLYEYGEQVYKKLLEANKKTNDFGDKPEDQIIKPYTIDENGGNFGLILKRENPENKKEYPNYEKSTYIGKAALFDGDKEALKNMFDMNKDCFYDIYDEIAEDKFKSYEELEAGLIRVFGDIYHDVMGDEVKVTGSAKYASENDVEFSVDETDNVDEKLDDEIPEFEKEEPVKENKEEDEDFADFFN